MLQPGIIACSFLHRFPPNTAIERWSRSFAAVTPHKFDDSYENSMEISRFDYVFNPVLLLGDFAIAAAIVSARTYTIFRSFPAIDTSRASTKSRTRWKTKHSGWVFSRDSFWTVSVKYRRQTVQKLVRNPSWERFTFDNAIKTGSETITSGLLCQKESANGWCVGIRFCFILIRFWANCLWWPQKTDLKWVGKLYGGSALRIWALPGQLEGDGFATFPTIKIE